MKAISILRTVSNFLFSRANREFLIFLVFFALAGFFWLLTTLNETYEQEIKVPVRITNVPKNVVITSPDTDTLRITVSDKGYSLAAYLYGKARQHISVDFGRYAQANGTGTVSTGDLTKMVSQQLSASTSISRIKPENLSFTYNYGEKRRVPVRWKGVVRPDQLYFLAGTRYSPDSVTIYASREKLDSITTVYTKPLNCTDFHDSLVVACLLENMSGVKMVPNHVEITFLTDILTEASIDGIPVKGINMPAQKVLRTFPAKVKVQFVTGMKNYQALSAADFEVVADYRELSLNPSSKCNIYLRRVPAGVSRAKLEVSQVDYLIEERSTP